MTSHSSCFNFVVLFYEEKNGSLKRAVKYCVSFSEAIVFNLNKNIITQNGTKNILIRKQSRGQLGIQ